jgi:hypothetical protein
MQAGDEPSLERLLAELTLAERTRYAELERNKERIQRLFAERTGTDAEVESLRQIAHSLNNLLMIALLRATSSIDCVREGKVA